MSVWVVYDYDVHAYVIGIYATELDARRACDGQGHVIEVSLPCADVVTLIAEGDRS